MKCPGQDMQYWDSDAIYEVKCPECGHPVEFYKDDPMRKCSNCDHRFVNPRMDFGCASYCQFAQQCLGTLPEEFVLQQDNLLKDKVAVAVKRFFHRDFKRIRLTSQLAGHAEKIGKAMESSHLALILCSAYLIFVNDKYHVPRDFQSHITEEDDTTAEIAAKLLADIGADKTLIAQVCRILSGRPGEDEAERQAYKVIKDSLTITLLEEEYREKTVDFEKIKIEMSQLSSIVAKKEANRIFFHN